MLCSLVYILGIIRGNIFLLLSVSLFALLKVLPGVSENAMLSRQYALIYFIIFSIPVSGWIAAVFVEKNISSLYNRQFISRVVFIIAVAICFQSMKFTDYLIASLNWASGKSSLELTALIVSVSNNALKCAAIVACSILILVNMIELPFVWFCGAFGFTRRAGLNFAGLRPAFLFLTLIYIFDYITGFLSSKLWPGMV